MKLSNSLTSIYNYVDFLGFGDFVDFTALIMNKK